MALQGAAGVAMHLGGGEQAVHLAEQVHRAQPGDGHDAARGARAAGARQPAGRRHRRGRGGDRAGRRRRLPVRAGGPGARARPSPATRTVALADAEARRGDARGELLRPRRSGGSPACWPANGPATPAGSELWLERLSTLASSVGDVGFIAIAQVLHDRPSPAPTVPNRRRWRPAGAASSTPSSSAESMASPLECSRRLERLAAGPRAAGDTRSGPTLARGRRRSHRVGCWAVSRGLMAPAARAHGFAYQPALDGVRARRRGAWCCCSTRARLGGGYVGVSVFFTLSGYLITSLALVEHERTGRLDVGAFYGRRLRRLLPASLACLAGVVALAAVGCSTASPACGATLGRAGPGLQLGRPGRRAELRRPRRRRQRRRRRRSTTTGRWRSRSSSTGCGRSSWSSSCAPGRRGRLLAVGAMAAATAARRPADRRRLGPRRGVLGDAGPPRRDPRRRPAGRRPAPPRRAGRLPRRRRPGWRSPASASIVLGGRHVAERVRPGLRGLAAGVRPGVRRADRRAAGQLTAASSARRRARSSPSGRSATACTSTTGRCTSCSTPSAPDFPRCRCSPCGRRDAHARRGVVPAPRAPDPRPAPALAPGDPDRGGRLRLDRHRRRHRAGRLDPVLDGWRPEATAATLAPVDSVAELRPLAAVPTTLDDGDADDGAADHLGRRADDRAGDHDDDLDRGASRRGDPGPADRPVAAGADHGRR